MFSEAENFCRNLHFLLLTETDGNEQLNISMQQLATSFDLSFENFHKCSDKILFKYKHVGNWSGGVVIVLCRMLDALAGRTEPSGVKGTILIDGQRPPKGFKFMTGYVIQVYR